MLLTILALVSVTVTLAQEEAAEPEGPSVNPIEIFACSFNDGKSMEDLMGVTTEWNAWMDAEGRHDYWAYTLVPMYHSAEIDFDVAWVGGWPDGATMAASTEFWLKNGGKFQKAYAEVADCDVHVNFAVLDIMPSPVPFQEGPVEFTDCTVNEGRSVFDAIGGVNEWVAYLGEQGINAGQFVLFPAFGESSDSEYDFKWVTVSSYETFGKAYDQYGTGGGWRKYGELFGELMDCDSSRVYHGSPVRKVEIPE